MNLNQKPPLDLEKLVADLVESVRLDAAIQEQVRRRKILRANERNE